MLGGIKSCDRATTDHWILLLGTYLLMTGEEGGGGCRGGGGNRLSMALVIGEVLPDLNPHMIKFAQTQVCFQLMKRKCRPLL